MGKVSLVKTGRGIKKGLGEALELIGGLGRCIGKNDRVMLKPNLNGVEGCTDKALVEALIQLLSDFGTGEIFIAESAFGDRRNTEAFFDKTGFAGLARRYGLELVNLNESEPVEVRVENPLVLEKIILAREVFEADRIINLPNMKVHYATGVTLALKNLKGLLVGDEKKRFHEVGLDKAIADLNSIVKPCLNIIDCISCMERMGPRGGDPVRLELLIAGESAAEVDCVGCRVMGFQTGEVRHLEYCLEAGRIDPGRIEVLGERVEEVSRPFRKVSMENIVPGAVRVHQRNACSACMNALLLSCLLLENEPAQRVDVYLGSLLDENEVSAGGCSIAFGNCCPADGAFDVRIKGCPPYPFGLRDKLRDNMK